MPGLQRNKHSASVSVKHGGNRSREVAVFERAISGIECWGIVFDANLGHNQIRPPVAVVAFPNCEQ